MKVVQSTQSMQRLVRSWQSAKVPVAFVPTMGYLHAGHISLVERARRAVEPNGKVVVSIFVNPTQFAPTEDLAKYPRDLARDKKLCSEARVDVLFVPPDGDMYPPGYSTFVVEESLARGMEGSSRPTHFRGVATVVAKLFNIVLPQVAVFGAKDFQQAAVVSRMVRDLNFPLKIIVAPTFREKDGLAMSSRNKYLTPEQRSQAVILWTALQNAKKTVASSAIPATQLRNQLTKLIATKSEARLDYIEFFDPQTLQPVSSVGNGTRMALAVFFGKTRLIDNAKL
ncbi:MAG TPA: pantoate--beta-alanine ligase [Verrucomicrobiae bacterium]